MKLSVSMITYNHERYIRQALDGVLEQEVDFDYEIVVGEDCSTDSTRAILLEYRDRYPDRIRLLLHEKNIGAIPNFFNTIESCKGQYVALLEGDDYWTNRTKLKRQVAFLDSHPDYSICFHNVTGHFESGGRSDFNYVRADQKETMELEDLLQDNVIPTCSAVFRQGLVKPFPKWVYELKMGDFPLHILNAQHGRIGYLNEIMGVYRVHSGGVWTGMDWVARLRVNIKFFEFLAGGLEPRYRPAARTVLARKYFQLAAEYEARGDLIRARENLVKSLKARLFTANPTVRNKLRVLARVSVPSLYGMAGRVYGALSTDQAAPPQAISPAENPRVSVIIPAYNAQRYLVEAVESTLAQTFTDFECIVVDDGSTDRTPRLLDELSRRDSRVRPLRIPHGGIVEALNAGLHAARGELVARMDADDICVPERLAIQVRFMDQHPECMALGAKVMLVDPYGSDLWEIDVKTDHEEIEADLLRGNGWALFHPTAMLRKQAMLAVGGYRPEYQWSEDIDLFLRLAELGKLANLPMALLRYRQHFASVNRTKLELQLRRSERLLADAYRRRGRTLPADFKLVPAPQLTQYDQVLAWARRAIINRNLRAARLHALTAMRHEPLRYDSWSLMYHAVIGK